jgi:hypothetical protein
MRSRLEDLGLFCEAKVSIRGVLVRHTIGAQTMTGAVIAKMGNQTHFLVERSEDE